VGGSGDTLVERDPAVRLPPEQPGRMSAGDRPPTLLGGLPHGHGEEGYVIVFIALCVLLFVIGFNAGMLFMRYVQSDPGRRDHDRDHD
jgi:hypothetical protein